MGYIRPKQFLENYLPVSTILYTDFSAFLIQN